jgi:hypothetical protein
LFIKQKISRLIINKKYDGINSIARKNKKHSRAFPGRKEIETELNATVSIRLKSKFYEEI